MIDIVITMCYNIIVKRKGGLLMRKEEYEREVEEMSVFKSFLRSLMRQLKALEKALLENDTQKAKKIVSEIIEDTQKGIED